MEYNKEYVEKNLIAYIGNKRRLLPLIIDGINHSGIDSTKGNKKFLDLFAGTGVVSRLAKSAGFEVHTNDWEYYSSIMNRAFIGLDGTILSDGFQNLGGIDNALALLNSCEVPREEDRYIAEYYCPQCDDNPDLDNERLFYTQYNGLKIDAIRGNLQRWHDDHVINDNENVLLLALLLYEASTRSNTSGVFKAFHRGFGGTNGDALSRIMKKIELVKPVLCNGTGFVYNENALTLTERLHNTKFDLVYLDPPYNQHQYGSNYHLLNTIALNDKPEVNRQVIINGKKINKSAIRKDWIKTRSTFCYKDSAEQDFSQLIEQINADKIMISYSTDGIIPFDTILDILAKKGNLSIVTSEYEKYRGGKQALTSQLKNVEFIILVDAAAKKKTHDVGAVKNTLLMHKIEIALPKTVALENMKRAGFIEYDGYYTKKYGRHTIKLVIKNLEIAEPEELLSSLERLNATELENVYRDIEIVTSATREDEVYISIARMKELYHEGLYDDMKQLFDKVPYYLSKFNDKKAYIPSLRAISALLDLVDETRGCWIETSLLEQKSFQKIERIILKKLNNAQWENNDEAVHYKEIIGKKYDRLYDYCAVAADRVCGTEVIASASF